MKFFIELESLCRKLTVNIISLNVLFYFYTFLGGRSKATALCSKCPLCAPSQKGLFWDNPQRQIESTVLSCKPYALPCLSTISKSPSIFTDPLSLMVSFVFDIYLFVMSLKAKLRIKLAFFTIKNLFRSVPFKK